MEYELVLPSSIREAIQTHLMTDRTREQMAIVLCGRHQRGPRQRLLGRRVILPKPDEFSYQSAAGLMLDQEVQAEILRLAAREGLSQVDFHTHPGDGGPVTFSAIDDEHERSLAGYLARRLPDSAYASVVVNGHAASGRFWEITSEGPRPVELRLPAFTEEPLTPSSAPIESRFDRQVRAFGPGLQRRLEALRVGLVGCGGLGSICAEELTRLGVRQWVLIDPDAVDPTNLNRLLGSTPGDAEDEQAKVDVAERSIRAVDPNAAIEALRCSVNAPRALRALTTCDLAIVATDNHASRLIVNALAAQYLIPLVHVGVNLAVRSSDGGFEDISGEVAIPAFGAWCLACAGVVSAEQAGWEVARSDERRQLAVRGYLADTPAPAVVHLNGVVASLAVAEIHNLIYPYKPLRRWLAYRQLESELLTIEVSPQPSCLHCSVEGRLGLGDVAPLWRMASARAIEAPPASEPAHVEEAARSQKR